MRIKELSSEQCVAEEFFPSYLNDVNLVYRWRQSSTGKIACDKIWNTFFYNSLFLQFTNYLTLFGSWTLIA